MPPKNQLTVMRGPTRGRNELATREVLEEAGGREALEEALELSGADPMGSNPIDSLLAKLRDTNFATHSLTELARPCGLSRVDLFELLGKRDVALAVFMSRRKHFAAVLDDIGEDSLSRMVLCRTCNGEQTLQPEPDPADVRDANTLKLQGIEVEVTMPDPVSCPDCNGVGYLRKIGDAQARSLFMKLHGFDKGGAGSINPTFNIGVGVQVRNDNSGKPQQEPINVKVERLLDGGGG